MPPMLRRRLSQLGRAATDALAPLLAYQPTALVVSSEHGDIQRSYDLLSELAQSETATISPTDFSLSVFNAIAGLQSLVYPFASYSCVSAGQGSFAAAVLEACGMLEDGTASKIVVLNYDQSLPLVYTDFAQTAENILAFAMCIRPPCNTDATHYSLTWNYQKSSQQSAGNCMDFPTFFASEGQSTFQQNGWIWRRHSRK